LRAIGFALGGTPGSRLAAVLGLETSAATLLRRIRDAPPPDPPAPRAVGVDDYALRKGHTYGTILIDLERGHVLDLLPDRTAQTLAAWLQAHPTIEVVSRDRAGAYAEGARQGAPGALQVADRFHLVKNLGDAVGRVLSRHSSLLAEIARTGASATSMAPELPDAGQARLVAPSAAQRASAESRARRQARYQEVMALRACGASLEEIAPAVGLAVTTVHRWVHADGFPERARHRRGADAVVQRIRKRWEAGCHNATAIWKALVAEGFTGSKRMVQREIAHLGLCRGQSARGAAGVVVVAAKPPSPRHLAWLCGREETAGTEEEQTFLRMLCERSPELAQVRDLARRFVVLLREHDIAGFETWLLGAQMSELRGFARSLLTDAAAVRAAVSTSWSNGPTEGHVNRLKTLKRAMYGRAGFALLKARVLHAA
jgi:transposase